MPRANRHFLPGHVWHITINAAASSNGSILGWTLTMNGISLRSVQNFKGLKVQNLFNLGARPPPLLRRDRYV